MKMEQKPIHNTPDTMIRAYRIASNKIDDLSKLVEHIVKEEVPRHGHHYDMILSIKGEIEYVELHTDNEMNEMLITYAEYPYQDYIIKKNTIYVKYMKWTSNGSEHIYDFPIFAYYNPCYGFSSFQNPDFFIVDYLYEIGKEYAPSEAHLVKHFANVCGKFFFNDVKVDGIVKEILSFQPLPILNAIT